MTAAAKRRPGQALPRKMTTREAAEKFGVSMRSVTNYAAHPREEYLAAAQAMRKRIWAQLDRGLGVREVARRLNVSPSTVSRAAHHPDRPRPPTNTEVA